jgi:hypothetical protein
MLVEAYAGNAMSLALSSLSAVLFFVALLNDVPFHNMAGFFNGSARVAGVVNSIPLHREGGAIG